MADAAIGVVTETLLNMIISFTSEKISLARGVKDELEKLKKHLEMLQAVLDQAHQQPISNTPVQLWLKELRSVILEAKIVLEEFGYEVLRQKLESRKMEKVRAFVSCSSNPLSFRLKMAEKIKDVLHSIEDLYAKSKIIDLPVKLLNSPLDLNGLRLRLTSPYIEESHIVGREENVKDVIDLLTQTYKNDLPVITIHGMGGQGKTTLAQLLYKNDKVKSSFDETIWVCVSEDFDVRRLLEEIFQSLTKTSSQLTNKEALVRKLKGELNNKKYLLVLDDVWNEDEAQWNAMRTCLLQIGDVNGSKILATTRSENVASTMGSSKCYRLGRLSEDLSWKLFDKYAFADGGPTRTQQLEDIGRRILDKCGGLPLAIKTIASLLHSKKFESEWLMIERSRTWDIINSGGGRVLASIKLSYDHLPSLSMKQCFAYCAIFEKDTILEKDRLIQLWMALGLLSSNHVTCLHMEEIGSVYFDFLLKSSLFQDAQKDDDNNIIACKMHDIVHDFASQVSANYCYLVKDWRAITSKIDAVHVSIKTCETKMWKRLIPFLPSNLQTLILEGEYVDLPKDLFENFKCLSVLMIKEWYYRKPLKLSSSIRKLKRLRFLDIQARLLPMSFTKLYHLQTLKAGRLTKVPKGFTNLTNLRHIDLTEFSPLPESNQLRNMQTISLVEWKEYDIEELEHLYNLKGELKLFSLHRVKSYESAVKSNLSKKPGVQTLELFWLKERLYSFYKLREGDNDNIDVIMAGLKPHPNLKKLIINGFPIRKLPSWMLREQQASLSLQNLATLELSYLLHCETLPALGNFPKLEHLNITGLPSVKRIGEEFYGCPSKESNISDCSGLEIVYVFPALKTFELKEMDSLKEWSFGIVPAAHSSSVQLRVFPCLEGMILKGLPKLNVFSEKLGSQNVRVLSDDYSNTGLGSLQELGADDDDDDDDDDDRKQNYSYDDDDDDDDVSMDSYIYHQPKPLYFPLLRRLSMHDCGERSGSVFCSLIPSSAPLEVLDIIGHPGSWPIDLYHLTNLNHLSLGVGDASTREEHDVIIPWPYPTISTVAANHYANLQRLTLVGLPKLKCLPHQLQYLASLTELTITRWDALDIVPEWLGHLKCLQRLSLDKCKNLKELPSAKSLQRLTHLTIVSCGQLNERCSNREGHEGSEWHKISHIPNLKIY